MSVIASTITVVVVLSDGARSLGAPRVTVRVAVGMTVNEVPVAV